MTTRLTVSRQCVGSDSGSSTNQNLGFVTETTFSSSLDIAQFVGEFRARTTNPPLTLMPLDEMGMPLESIVPTGPKAVDEFGQSAAVLRAEIENIPAGNYDVTIRVEDFDVEVSGHNGVKHAQPPPVGLLGSFNDVEPTGQPETMCTIQVDSTGGGFCDLMFRSDQLAGELFFVATTMIQGQEVEAEANLLVQIRNLTDISGAFNRGFELDNAALARHPSPNFLRSDLVSELLEIQKSFQELTSNEMLLPEGSYLSFNDMSLPLGGLFDIGIPIGPFWNVPHDSHRKGTSVDINTARYSVASEGVRVFPSIGLSDNDDLRIILREACLAGGASLLPEEEDPKLHCEFK